MLVIAADGYLSKLRWTDDNAAATYWFNPGFASETSAYIDLGAGRKNEPWTGTPGGTWDTGVLPSPDGTQLVFLTRDEGVIVAGVVVIPLGDPGAAITVPGSTAGVASWQPLAE